MNVVLTLIYGALLSAAVIRTFYVGDLGLRLAALAIGADWIMSNALWWVSALQYRTAYAPVSDLAFGIALLAAFILFDRMWLAVLAALYVISGVVGIAAYGPGSHYSFDLALNAAFLARLAVVWVASQEPRQSQERV